MQVVRYVLTAAVLLVGAVATIASSPAGEGEGEGEGDSSGFCYRLKGLGQSPSCECYPEEQDFSTAFYDVVSTCGEPGDECYAEILTGGDVVVCECFTPICLEDASGHCECKNGATIDVDQSTARSVTSCPAGNTYCRDAFGGCHSAGSCSPPEEEIATCDLDGLPPVNDNRTPESSCTSVF